MAYRGRARTCSVAAESATPGRRDSACSPAAADDRLMPLTMGAAWIPWQRVSVLLLSLGLLIGSMRVVGATSEAMAEVNPATPPGSSVASATSHLQATPEGHPLTAADASAYIDGLMPYGLETGDIAGSAVVVIKGGMILVSKSYGYADVAAHRKFTVDDTLVRLGSISKLFTWTALMQQVELGHVALDADVNRYLDFAIPETCGGPITVRDLMTHTAGFEEVAKDLYFLAPHPLTSIGSYVRTHIPACLFPPGKTIAYSNYGATLAAYIVERTSGLPFATYIERNIFGPLGMAHSTFEQPLPQSLRPFMSKGYALGSGQPGREELIQVSPAGGLWATPGDIARFMLAHLQGGQLDGHRILRAATVDLMHSHQVSPALGFNGMALGFYEMSRNGYRVISHAGDTNLYHSAIYLIPAAQVGLFVTFNSRGLGGVAAENIDEALFRGFMNRYFPGGGAQCAPLPEGTAKRDAAAIAGNYIVSRRAESTFMRLSSIAGSGTEFSVIARPNGTLETAYFQRLDGRPETWREIAPLLYHEINGPDRMVFVRNATGAIDHMTTDADLPVYVSQPVPMSENSKWLVPLLRTMVIAFLGVVIVVPIGSAVYRIRGRNRPLIAGPSGFGPIVWAWSAVNLAVVGGWHYLVTCPRINPLFSSALNPWLVILYLAGWIGVAGAGWLVYCVQTVARRGNASIREGLSVFALALIGLSYAWFLWDFNLLSFTLRY